MRVHKLPGIHKLLGRDIIRIVYREFILIAFLGCNDNNAIGTACTVDGRCGGILENFH